MPPLNEPDYEVIKAKVIRCLRHLNKDATEQDETAALKRLDKVWPNVVWTNWNNVIEAIKEVAKYVADGNAPQPPKKKRGRPPKSKVVKEEKDEEQKVEVAEVDESLEVDVE